MILANCAVQRVTITDLTVGQVDAATAGEISVAVPGCVPGDIGYFVGNQANATGIVYNGARCAVAGTMLLRFCNPSAGNLTPPATDDYTLFIFKATGQVQSV